ncbi:Protein phosphatase 1 regulatory subunit 3C [Smittium culicis]|uniref:Protein phosphatase 1 regulatory subunit 3C n=1 Tax=Smittium culicis TaxID=133412 RepID=A0A1R1XJ58_9FUNG|nr:Protein phosphatase 1 regulatory subunit 3C [Smittium culicis]OMJ14677.1 Protein phosphatase 1 regulatory subunit 3C [Smittium culicis]
MLYTSINIHIYIMYISATPITDSSVLANSPKTYNLKPYVSLGSKKTCPSPKPSKKISNPNLKACIRKSASKEQLKPRKKSVSFSDNLEACCLFFKCEEPLACNRKIQTSSEGLNVKTKLICVRGPARQILSSAHRNVFLESVRLDNDMNLIYGNVTVSNIAFEKQVLIRYTMDNWSSYSDITADFSKVIVPRNSDIQGSDCFTFVLQIPPIDTENTSYLDFPITQKIEFCLLYKVNGVEHWDNNCSRNYLYNVISYTPSPISSSNTNFNSKKAIHPKDPSFPVKVKSSSGLWELTKPKELVFSSKLNFIQAPSTSFQSSKPTVSSGLKHSLNSSPSIMSRNFSTSEIPWSSFDFYDYSISQPRSLSSQHQYQQSSTFDSQQSPLQSINSLNSSFSNNFNSSQPPIHIKKNKKELSQSWYSHSPPNYSPPQPSFFASTQC